MEEMEIKEASNLRQEFTPRETDVIYLLLNGMKNEEIANTLHISLSTVKVNLTKVYEKLGVKNRTQAVAKIYGENIILHQDSEQP